MDGLKKQVCLLVLLFVGSTSLWAQAVDPFPEVDTHKYADNMTIFGQVRRNGAAVGGSTVVAVYHDDELRGKGTVFSQGRHTDIFLIQVWGDTKGDALVFKVSTGSQLFTVDQGLTAHRLLLHRPAVVGTGRGRRADAHAEERMELGGGIPAGAAIRERDGQCLQPHTEPDARGGKRPAVRHDRTADRAAARRGL